MEGTAFTIEEASFDASLLPEGSRTPGSEDFHRAVTDYFQRSYASMGGQLSVVFAAGRIEVAWEPAAPKEPAMASIGPLLQQRRHLRAKVSDPCAATASAQPAAYLRAHAVDDQLLLSLQLVL